MTNSRPTRNQELHPAPEEHKRSSRLPILQEKAACSPRASVALSAFSAVTWLREASSLIYRRITDRRPAKNVVRPWCKVRAIRRWTDLCLLIIVLTLSRGVLQAQAPSSAAVPRLVGYSGKLMDAEGKPLARIAGETFAIYTDENLYLGMTNTVHKFRVDTNGAVHADGALNSSGTDFAESVAIEDTRAEYEPGDVLEIDKKANRHLALSPRPYATLVAGIYSTKPGVLASPHHIDEVPSAAPEVPLAIVGIAPCKVTAENGPIARGDLLVTSSRLGYGMKDADRRGMLGAVVGQGSRTSTQRR